MRKLNICALVAIVLGLAAGVGTAASAAPIGNLATVPDRAAMDNPLLDKVHWRGWRHCHWRHGWRRCHGDYGYSYGYPYYYGGYGWWPGIHLGFGHRHHHHRNCRNHGLRHFGHHGCRHHGHHGFRVFHGFRGGFGGFRGGRFR